MAEKIEPGFWNVVHQCFKTDNVGYRVSVVKASTGEEAVLKFNEVAKDRDKYPYFWNQVTLKAVYPLEVIE